MPRHPADHIPTDFGKFDLDVAEPIVPQLYAALRRKILTLELKPGYSVSESELALAAGVSRTPARQVIKQLVGENLLVAFTSRGTYVSKIDTRRLKDALIIRHQLEPYLAAQCANDPNRAKLVSKLREIIDEHGIALTAGTVDRAYQIDAAFHKAICTREGDGLLWQTIRQARTEADRLHTLSRDRTNSLQTALGHHREIVDAIESGNAKQSFAAMEKHMQINEEAFAQILKENPELFS
jgi:GntR family transcriptional regulator, rspAB operon transcriptional repressor